MKSDQTDRRRTTVAALLLLLTARATPGAQCRFRSEAPLVIGGATVASTITVAEVVGPVTKVRVGLVGLREWVIGVEELDLLVKGPGGHEVVLMSFACIETSGPLDLWFDADAAVPIPSADYTTGAPCTSGEFRTGDYHELVGGYLLKNNPPAPNPPYPDELADLAGVDANGVWSLYAAAFTDLDDAALAGWELRIEAASCALEAIFANGFESGLSGWSATAP